MRGVNDYKMYIRHMIIAFIIIEIIVFLYMGRVVNASDTITSSEFADINFYHFCVRLADTDADGVLSVSEARSLTVMKLENLDDSITSLKGIENFTELEFLYIGYCELTDISYITELQNLEELHFNAMKTIDDYSVVGELTGLQVFSVYNCSITDISFLKYLTQLTKLTVGKNMQLTDYSPLKYTSNVQILSLECSGENLKDISMLSKYRNMVEINIEGTAVSSIDSLSRSEETLQTLYANDAQITDISILEDFIELHQVRLQNNRITEIPDLMDLTKLKELSLSGNPLTTATLLDLENLLPTSITHVSDWQSSVLDTDQINQMNNPTEETTGDPTGDQPDDSTTPSTGEETDSDEEDTTPPDEDSPNYKVLEDVLGSGATVRGDIDDGIYFESLRIYNLASQPEAVALVKSKVKYLHTFEIYDMGLYRKQLENGVRVKVQPNGTVEVSVPINYEEGMYGRVWHREADGSFRELKTFLKDGEIHFYTDKFSIFVLVITKLFGGGMAEDEQESLSAPGQDGDVIVSVSTASNDKNPVNSDDQEEDVTSNGNHYKEVAKDSTAESKIPDNGEVIHTETERQNEQKEMEDKTTKREATNTNGMASASNREDGERTGSIRVIAIVVITTSLVGTVIYTRVRDIGKVLRGEKG